MALLTTTTGWFPKPATLKLARWRLAEEEIEPSELQQAEEQATRDVLRLQEDLGLDLLVDGQMDRGDMVTHFAERLDGFEIGGLVRCYGNRYYRKPRIVDEVGRPGPLTVERWQAAQAAAQRPVKAVITGPYTLMDWSFDEHYASRHDCCMALAELMREEAEALLAAGATEIQIDEPAISARADEMGLVAEALGRVTANLRGRARTWTHLCYGDVLPVLREILALPVDGILVELSDSAAEALQSISRIPPKLHFGAGVIDVASPRVETPEEIRGRVEGLLNKIPAERLWLAPDAGLHALTGEQARAKLEAMVAAARSFG